MAHGIYFNHRIKHGDIVDFSMMFKPHPTKREAFKANYQFIWDIYQHVAEQNGIKLPWKFISVELLTRNHRYVTHQKNAVILEPLGPTTYVDHSYSLTGVLNPDSQRGIVLSDINWYRNAERFFMVHGSAATALNTSNSMRFRTGIMAAKFRAIKVRKKKPGEE